MRARPVAAVVLFALALFLIGLGRAGLSEPDEPYYAVPALEMVGAGSWGMPLLHGRPWFDKPILFYWVVGSAFRLFGASEWAARIGSALAGTAGVACVYVLAERLTRRRDAALCAAVVVATSLEYALLARAAVTDMTFTLLLCLGMLALVRVLEGGGDRPAFAAGVAFGLATLTKGPVGILVPVLTILLHAFLSRRGDLLRPRCILSGSAGLLASAGPWYAYAAARYPELLWRTFIEGGNLGRFLHAEHASPLLYYAAVVPLGLLPWSGALPAALLRASGRRARERERGESARPGLLFALSWFLVVVGLFTLSASRLPSYVLPAFPPVAVLLGGYWAAVFEPREDDVPARGRRESALLGLAVAAAAALLLLHVAGRPDLAPARPAALLVAILLVSGPAYGALRVRRGRLKPFILTQAAAASAVILALVLAASPHLEGADSSRPLVRALQRDHLQAKVAGAFHVDDLGLDFYLNRPVPTVSDRSTLNRIVTENPGGVWIVQTGDLPSLSRDPGLILSIVFQGPRRSAVRLAGASWADRKTR